MTDQQHGRRAVPFGPTGRTVALNIARMRKVAGFSTRGLAVALEKRGCVVSQGGISRMEAVKRHVTVDELVALAAIFDVSPSALLLPLTDDSTDQVEITGAGAVPADQAWDWMDGRRRLDAPCDDPSTASVEYALYSRPPLRRSRELGTL